MKIVINYFFIYNFFLPLRHEKFFCINYFVRMLLALESDIDILCITAMSDCYIDCIVF